MGEIKKNLIYNVTYQILVIILPFITAPYISRVLGAHNVGVYSYTQAFANYFYLFAMLGVMNYGNRTIAAVRDDFEEIKRRFWEIFFFPIFCRNIGLYSVCFLLYLFCNRK